MISIGSWQVVYALVITIFFFFFKQKTAYEMRISDWSSDVCSSDLKRQTLPLVFASPHSGSDYTADFLASSRLDPMSLRRSEDSFVHEIFGCAPEMGAPLLHALFPRAFVDPNREP